MTLDFFDEKGRHYTIQSSSDLGSRIEYRSTLYFFLNISPTITKLTKHPKSYLKNDLFPDLEIKGKKGCNSLSPIYKETIEPLLVDPF